MSPDVKNFKSVYKTKETFFVFIVSSIIYLLLSLEETVKILNGARLLFMRIGIKSVSMDDIAQELRMSKKTIYKYFKDKRDLVGKVIDTKINEDKTALKKFASQNSNAIQRMIDFSRYISQTKKDLNPTIIYDMQKFYPNQWRKMDEFRSIYIRNTVKNNIKMGIKSGLFRTDINADIIAIMYITLISGMMQQLVSSKNNYQFQTIHFQMVSYHLHGICTDKGRIYLKQHINEISNII
ncbi:TetR/AcrR family transcriptional regulator [Bacteroidia bacterium]|jgi:TetR/AcrR family transcriptional regulator, cholesterol catabolism regulator|nr:TetR/AcrR family transcriptional regulator [Bacteroidia bacterium]